MGYEYRVKFTYESVAHVDEFLRALPCFHDFEEARATYIYRRPENTGTMPDAEISIRNEELYLCHFGTSLISLFTEQLNARLQNVQIEDWEL
jgi:hypothetical protein